MTYKIIRSEFRPKAGAGCRLPRVPVAFPPFLQQFLKQTEPFLTQKGEKTQTKHEKAGFRVKALCHRAVIFSCFFVFVPRASPLEVILDLRSQLAGPSRHHLLSGSNNSVFIASRTPEHRSAAPSTNETSVASSTLTTQRTARRSF